MNSPVLQEDKITPEQIKQLQDLLGEFLQQSGLSHEGLQKVLDCTRGTFKDELERLVRRHIEAHSDLVVRTVKNVDRTRNLEEALKSAGLEREKNPEFYTSAPVGEDDEVELVFFKIGQDVKDRERYVRECAVRGLAPADPLPLAYLYEDPENAPPESVVYSAAILWSWEPTWLYGKGGNGGNEKVTDSLHFNHPSTRRGGGSPSANVYTGSCIPDFSHAVGIRLKKNAA